MGPLATDPNALQADYVERLFMDYRRSDAENVTPQSDFGIGCVYAIVFLDGIANLRPAAPINKSHPNVNSEQ